MNSEREPFLSGQGSILGSDTRRSSNLSQETGGEGSEGETEAILEVGVVGDSGSGEELESGRQLVEKKEMGNGWPLVAFLIGVMSSLRRVFDAVMMSEWLSWRPFWRQEKRLELLIAEADANPGDAAKQSALLAELNKHRFGPPFLGDFLHFFFSLCFSEVFIPQNKHSLGNILM